MFTSHSFKEVNFLTAKPRDLVMLKGNLMHYVMEIEIIHRLFLVIAMYCQAGATRIEPFTS